MREVLHALVAATSVALGSWVGLHPAAESSPHSPPPEPPAASSDDAAELFPRSLPDTTLASGPTPWPRLNPQASIAEAWRLAEGPHRQPGDKRRLVTLTFDDGPFPETTPRVLDLLAKYDVRATFFVVGLYLDGVDERAQASRAVMRQIVDGGHLIGNHTHDHALLTSVSHTQVLEQIDRGAASIERVIGKRPFLFRPPFGQLDEFGEQAARDRQLDLVLWNVEARDMERDDVSSMFHDLVRQLSYNEGGIVLLHDIRWTSVKILRRLLAYLDKRRFDPTRPDREGYELVDLPTYLRAVEASPPQPGAREGLGRNAPRSDGEREGAEASARKEAEAARKVAKSRAPAKRSERPH